MISKLLINSMDRISSLRHFYETERDNIDKVSRNGVEKNKFGYLAYRYLIAIGSKDEEDATEEIKQLKQRIEPFFDVVDCISLESGKYSLIRFKEPDRLKKTKWELNFKEAAIQYQRFLEMPTIHGSNTLIMLITRFEEFIADLLSEVYIMFPQKYLDKQTISFSEIIDADIDDVRQKIVKREVDRIMRESYTEWFKLLESHNMKFDYLKPELEKLNEIYARRNIHVHNSGKVNTTYLANTHSSTYKIDDVLTIDRAYISEAFSVIETLIFGILFESVKLIKKDEKEKHVMKLFDCAFEKLSSGNYELCKKVFEFLTKSKDIKDSARFKAKINYWIAKVQSDGLPSVKSEIEEYDVSALSKEFALAKYILLEQYDKATKLLDELLLKKELLAYMVERWPLFINYRNTPQYESLVGKHSALFQENVLELCINCVDETDVHRKKRFHSTGYELAGEEIDNQEK